MKNVVLTWSLTMLAWTLVMCAELFTGDLMVNHVHHAVTAADLFAGR